MSQETSPLFFERYELKYQVPYRLVESITHYLMSYCEMDYYSQISPDGFYKINSLYFDTQQFNFYDNKENLLPYRMNMRIRSYGEKPQPPYFFEIKEKRIDFVKKKRAAVHTNDIEKIFEGRAIAGLDYPESSKKNLDYFLLQSQLFNAEPQVLTQYRRRAFFSKYEDYVRITFDVDLKFKEEKELNIWPLDDMNFYDQEDIFDLQTESCAVLELKCESRIPIWFIDMISRFELERSSFSKYGNSIRRSKKMYW